MVARRNELRQIFCKKHRLDEVAPNIEAVVEDELARLVCLDISFGRSLEIFNVVVACVIVRPELDQHDAGVWQANATERRVEVRKCDRLGPIPLIGDPICPQLFE